MDHNRFAFAAGLATVLLLCPDAFGLTKYVTVRAGEACQGTQYGDRQHNAQYDENGVLEADPSYGSKFWCRVEVPDGMWITDVNVYGRDADAGAAITLQLRRASYSASTSSSIDAWNSVTSTSSWDTDLCHEVDKENYSYYLYLYIPSASRSDLEVWSFDIRYTDTTCE